jgi:VIT1/CCC1 family predicted Fe2+/Mn2+ transporter
VLEGRAEANGTSVEEETENSIPGLGRRQIDFGSDAADRQQCAESFLMNPEDLGSPWASALSSLATFAAGAMVPLVPWFITTGVSAVVGSLALAGGAALAIGALLGQLTGGRWLRSALRQLVVVALASGVTFLVGSLFGAAVF